MNDAKLDVARAVWSAGSGWLVRGAAAVGVTSTVWAAYAGSGLPVPATIHQVEQRIAAVNATIRELKADTLQGQRSTIGLTKNFLRSEHEAVARAARAGEPAARVTMRRRLGEIEDQMRILDETDAELRKRIQDLRPR